MTSAGAAGWRIDETGVQSALRRVALCDPVTRSRELARRAVHRLGHMPVVLDGLRPGLARAESWPAFDLALISCPSDADLCMQTLVDARALFGPDTALVFVAGKSRTLRLRAACTGIRESVVVRPSSFGGYYGLMHQSMRRQGFELAEPELEWGPYRFQPATGTVQFAGRVTRLPPLEFDLAMEFFRNLDRTLSRERLYMTLWERFDADSRALDTQVSRLRRKLELESVDGWALRSASGIGYRLVSPRGRDAMALRRPVPLRYASTATWGSPAAQSA